MNTRKKLLVVALILAFGPVLWACMFIANDWLLSGQAEFLRTPRAIFQNELIRLGDRNSSEFRSVPATNGYFSQTLETELADLTGSLQQSGATQLKIQELLSQYEQARNSLNVLSERVLVWRAAGNTDPFAVDSLPRVPDGLPAEFAAYFEGCVQFHLGETNLAREAWYRLLDLPRADRLRRSTWAAFMLGKFDVDVDPQTAIIWLQGVRELARNGYDDTLGLASASYGWEARAQLKLKNPVAAIELYLEQQATGTLDSSSLRMAARAALDLPPEKLIEVADNQKVRAVVSSYLLSRRWNADDWYLAEDRNLWVKWLNAAATATTPDLQSAGQFAWVAYQCGQFETAKQWLPFTDPNSTGVLWLSAKLKLRDGDIDGAAQDLSRATNLMPLAGDDPANQPVQSVSTSSYPGPYWIRLEYSGPDNSQPARDRIHGEHGVLQFERRDYLQALNTFLVAGYWLDAAYVADRILTLNELQSYVDQFWPAADKDNVTHEHGSLEWRERKNREDIRYLLARRLSRNTRESDARQYYPDQWLPILDQLLTAFRDRRRPGAVPVEKAASLLAAARITRDHGLELYGTATEPDWQVYDGNFTYLGPSLEIRRELPEGEPLSPNADETERHSRSRPVPEKKFHYRHLAADLAWKAAELMPDQDDHTAAVLCEAGSWVKFSDPQRADRFYKALVIRCGYTELGTAADRKRWFPKMNSEGHLDEPMPPPVETTYSGPWDGDPNQ